MSLAHDVMHRVFDHFHCSDGSEQEPFAVNGELSILEAPDFELVFRADCHYTLLALKFVNMIDLLLVHTEASIDVLHVIDFNKDHGALRESHRQELLAVLAWRCIFRILLHRC